MGNLGLKMYFVAERALLMLTLMNTSPAPDNTKLFVSVLSQRSPEEVSDYLSFRSYKALLASGKIDVIDKEELYVSFSSESDGSFGCSCLFGSTILNPPMRVPTSKELREMWEYLQSVMLPYASCDFQSFVEKKIEEAWGALVHYEKMLTQEIIPIEYALASPQGVSIHNALYSEVMGKIVGLVDCKKIFERTSAPEFMIRENSAYQISVRKTLRVLRSLAPRSLA